MIGFVLSFAGVALLERGRLELDRLAAVRGKAKQRSGGRDAD
jgi:hypothetical protein